MFNSFRFAVSAANRLAALQHRPVSVVYCPARGQPHYRVEYGRVWGASYTTP
ncbi:MAG: hypothetical protein LCH53_04305 [Bacteroidetes bacterium]|nr:hypothetical protein [Bacteroidota bacterium]